MKILFSYQGHLKTMPMDDYISNTFKDMGNYIKLFKYGAHETYQKQLKKILRGAFFNNIDKKLISIFDEFKPDLFLYT